MAAQLTASQEGLSSVSRYLCFVCFGPTCNVCDKHSHTMLCPALVSLVHNNISSAVGDNITRFQNIQSLLLELQLTPDPHDKDDGMYLTCVRWG
jgi:hypothetical protein